MAKAALPTAFKETNDLRETVSGYLADAARAGGGRMIQESISFVYADGGSDWITEESPVIQSGFVGANYAAEAHALALDGGVVLRFAQFYSADSHHTVDQMAAARHGIATMLGKTDGYWSFIYADDAGSAVVAALNATTGIYNVGEDAPMTRREGAENLARLLGKKKLRTGPAGLAAKVPGKALSIMTGSKRVSSEKFKNSTGWSPQVPSQREGWPLILEELNK